MKPSFLIILLTWLLFVQPGYSADTNSVAELQQQVQKLKAENQALKQENQALRSSALEKRRPTVDWSEFELVRPAPSQTTVQGQSTPRVTTTLPSTSLPESVRSDLHSTPTPQVVSNAPALRVSPPVAENGSYYGEPNQYGVPKTVNVGGYFRKDGTYVRGYYRSAPRR